MSTSNLGSVYFFLFSSIVLEKEKGIGNSCDALFTSVTNDDDYGRWRAHAV